jgi:hypothetical protein
VREYYSAFAYAHRQHPLSEVKQTLSPRTDYRWFCRVARRNEFRSFITNQKLTEELRKRFESYIGEPKGEPVIR